MAWNLRFHSPSEIKNGEHVAQFPLVVQMFGKRKKNFLSRHKPVPKKDYFLK